MGATAMCERLALGGRATRTFEARQQASLKSRRGEFFINPVFLLLATDKQPFHNWRPPSELSRTSRQIGIRKPKLSWQEGVGFHIAAPSTAFKCQGAPPPLAA